MLTKDLFHDLYTNQVTYKQLHNQTADMDLRIMELYSKGKSAVQISMDIPCAEATVYRAKERVTRFLNDELPRNRNNVDDTIYVHNAMLRGINTEMGLQSHKLYHLLIHAHQNLKDYVDGKVVHEHIPGLRNKNQREAALRELNEFIVIPDETPKRNVKVFEFVTYDETEYRFKLTKEARPYYNVFYALLKMLGIESGPD